MLTVPPRLTGAAPAGPVLFKQILCPVDFSDCSLHALKYALSLAQEADGCLTLVHVLDADLTGVPNLGVNDETLSLAEFRRHREEQARRQLADAVPASAGDYCRAEPLIVRGNPSREILRLAAKRHADLIVLGVHGRGRSI